ncbi:hypothetical protein V6N11_077769 [Hibiscus sabdariffa]|uniref:Uncharacterized protein n=1 Tax=Hibiscus sabdariffa TaxID=183260 RepID=A0ABR2TEZ1_9ROSI
MGSSCSRNAKLLMQWFDSRELSQFRNGIRFVERGHMWTGLQTLQTPTLDAKPVLRKLLLDRPSRTPTNLHTQLSYPQQQSKP